jgi:hypothetical protein
MEREHTMIKDIVNETFWVARDGKLGLNTYSFQLYAHVNKPQRDSESEQWMIPEKHVVSAELDYFVVFNTKHFKNWFGIDLDDHFKTLTWADEPVQITVKKTLTISE